ncbi:MAG: OmpA family protein [Prolixibacteraceae bacterium]
MKKTILAILFSFPFLLFAQKECNFFEYTTSNIEELKSVNTVASDFGPAIVNDTLWFSAFSDDEIGKLSKGGTKDVFYNLFSAPVNSEGNVTGKKENRLESVSSGFHSGPVSWCPATKELFVTLSNYKNRKIENKVYQRADIRLRIVIMQQDNGEWTIKEELPFNSPEYSVGHPAISNTGDTLFFTAKIPDYGNGKTDIYMSVRKNGKWGNMKNLGATINTAQDEMFPFLFKGNMLIFASNGLNKEETGLDLYYSCITNNGFSASKPLETLNSGYDDFGLVIHENEEFGYFTSKKPGGKGDDDIYKISFKKKNYVLELMVQDKKSMKPIPSATVRFSDNLVKQTNHKGIIQRELDYAKDYTATSEVEGYMNESVSFTTKEKESGTLKETINIEKVEVGQKFTMENIFYDFNKWDILPESEVELDKLVKIMKDNPGWKVELGSHTDSRGSDAYNKILSQKRSDSAVSYIVSNGISKDRIIAKGYGETQLVNRCDDGVKCSEKEHRKNRRTEFKILKMED